MIKKSVLKKFKFNENYEIIGDFDLFIKLSLKYMFLSIQEPLSYYRLHDNNFSRKYSLHASELQSWIKIKVFLKKKLVFPIKFIICINLK